MEPFQGSYGPDRYVDPGWRFADPGLMYATTLWLAVPAGVDELFDDSSGDGIAGFPRSDGCGRLREHGLDQRWARLGDAAV